MEMNSCADIIQTQKAFSWITTNAIPPNGKTITVLKMVRPHFYWKSFLIPHIYCSEILLTGEPMFSEMCFFQKIND